MRSFSYCFAGLNNLNFLITESIKDVAMMWKNGVMIFVLTMNIAIIMTIMMIAIIMMIMIIMMIRESSQSLGIKKNEGGGWTIPRFFWWIWHSARSAPQSDHSTQIVIISPHLRTYVKMSRVTFTRFCRQIHQSVTFGVSGGVGGWGQANLGNAKILRAYGMVTPPIWWWLWWTLY